MFHVRIKVIFPHCAIVFDISSSVYRVLRSGSLEVNGNRQAGVSRYKGRGENAKKYNEKEEKKKNEIESPGWQI